MDRIENLRRLQVPASGVSDRPRSGSVGDCFVSGGGHSAPSRERYEAGTTVGTIKCDALLGDCLPEVNSWSRSAAPGRQRQSATVGCSRSFGIVSGVSGSWLGERQVSKWTGRSRRKLPRAVFCGRCHSATQSRTAAASLLLTPKWRMSGDMKN